MTLRIDHPEDPGLLIGTLEEITSAMRLRAAGYQWIVLGDPLDDVRRRYYPGGTTMSAESAVDRESPTYREERTFENDRQPTAMETVLQECNASVVRLDEVAHELATRLAKVLGPERPDTIAGRLEDASARSDHVETIDGISSRARRTVAFIEDLIVRLEV